jgi:hypothetical protein
MRRATLRLVIPVRPATDAVAGPAACYRYRKCAVEKRRGVRLAATLEVGARAANRVRSSRQRRRQKKNNEEIIRRTTQDR